MRLAGRVRKKVEREKYLRSERGKLKERDELQNLIIDGRVMSKWISLY